MGITHFYFQAIVYKAYVIDGHRLFYHYISSVCFNSMSQSLRVRLRCSKVLYRLGRDFTFSLSDGLESFCHSLLVFFFLQLVGSTSRIAESTYHALLDVFYHLFSFLSCVCNARSWLKNSKRTESGDLAMFFILPVILFT